MVISKEINFYCVFFRLKQEVDGIATGLIATPDRAIHVDFAFILWEEPYVMVVPRPGEEPRLFAIIKPFQPIVMINSFQNRESLYYLDIFRKRCGYLY